MRYFLGCVLFSVAEAVNIFKGTTPMALEGMTNEISNLEFEVYDRGE